MKSTAILGELPLVSLEALVTAAVSGWVAPGSPRAALSQVVGTHAASVGELLSDLEAERFSHQQAATLFQGAWAARRGGESPEPPPELVISGPDVSGVPTADTHAVVQGLFQQAASEVVLVGAA